MEVRMERRFSMDDLLEAGRVRESAQAQMRRLGWLQPHSARRGREGAGAMSDRELRASGRRGVGSGERGVGSGSAERGGAGGAGEPHAEVRGVSLASSAMWGLSPLEAPTSQRSMPPVPIARA